MSEDISRHIAVRLANLCNKRDWGIRQWRGKFKKDGKTKAFEYPRESGELTLDYIKQHISKANPEYSIAMNPVIDGKTSVIVFDMDDHDGTNPHDVARACGDLRQALDKVGYRRDDQLWWPSGSGAGYHIWVVLAEPLPWEEAFAFGKAAVKHIGFEAGNKSAAAGEIAVFPNSERSLFALPGARQSVIQDAHRDIPLWTLPAKKPEQPKAVPAPEQSEAAPKRWPGKFGTKAFNEGFDLLKGVYDPNDRDQWIDFGYLLKASFGDDAKELWIEWGMSASGADPREEQEKRWESIGKKKPIDMPAEAFWTKVKFHQKAGIERHVEAMCEKYKLVTHKGSAAFWRKGFNPELGVEEWVELSEADLKRECHYAPSVGQYLRNREKPSYPNGFYFDPTTTEWRHGAINLWTDWAIKGEAKPWPTIERHIREVLADKNEEYYQYILRWTAYFVQHPDVMPEVALVFQGGKGVGKGFYGRALCSLAPNHSIQVSHASQVTGRFNDHMYQTIMFFADEAFWAGDKSGEGQLKRQVTDDTLTIEGKNKKIFKARNMLHMIIVSNEDWVVPATPGERRWAVFKVSDRLKGDHAFFATLAKAYAGEEMQGFFHELKTMPLGDWHPRGAVPETNALQEQKARSEALAPEAALRRWLDRGVLPGTNAAHDGAPNELMLPWALHDATGVKVNKTTLPLALTKVTGAGVRRRIKLGEINGKQRSRQEMFYIFPPLQEARAAFDSKYAWDQSVTNWIHEYDDEEQDPLPQEEMDALPF